MLGYYNYTVILTYIGMLSGFYGITRAMNGNVWAAVGCLMIAGVCDMFDGKIASTMDRTPQEKRFGIQIDSLSDLVCFGLLPALIVYALNPKHLMDISPLCGLYALAALIRLSWFNVDEEERQNSTVGPREYYLGLPVTTSAVFLPAALGLSHVLHWNPVKTGVVVLICMAAAFLTPFRVKKPHLGRREAQAPMGRGFAQGGKK